MRPPLRTSLSDLSRNHANINALRRWTLNAYDIRNLRITPNTASPTTKIDIKVDLVAMHSIGGEVAIKSTPTSLTLNTQTTGMGGLDTGKLSASGLYSIYLAGQTSSENGVATAVGCIASSSWTGPALPAGYTHKRLVGAFATQDNNGSAIIKQCLQMDELLLYYEAQAALAWNGMTDPVIRTPLDLKNWVPPLCDEAHLDARVSGGTAPFGLKLFEHRTGAEIVDLQPATEDFGHEALWVLVPRQLVDHSISVTNSVNGSINVLGFKVPIDQEF